ncbi:orotidine 5'-phosphate decarboxylase [Candidatus Curtissbacteria bacterium RIFCSPHIGHO2_01_FULL_41_11]|uniref:Orotidine-5'-phosphate decarboxylase n=1 Tax=Candidatus Curtissbacteria bacterium RIFCSPHIGHO2_01_FULL_41_11 TaxID=1797711 RepID=A0A1F5G702_9BACT|nr:MAG: orotidine 5'-phosphate decarboxylase [Candidatus Curtissbacteria bacterium RIFCSPHIGHO2_01_FULL_41_11]
MDFKSKLEKISQKNNSLLCVGLDPDPENLSGAIDQFEFNKKVVDETAEFVCCYKPQIAFYGAAGLKGFENLKKTIDYIHKNYSPIPVLLDGKRADIGHTSEMYTKEVFDFYEADAVTVIPYCGFDSIEPFFQRRGKGIFVICRTSNQGANDFQDLKVGDEPLYFKVAQKIVEWNKKYPNVFLEIGATWPGEIGILRKLAPNMPFLIAGIGAQGGDLEGTLKNGLTKEKKGLIISSSRGIIYAQNPKEAAKKLRDEINRYRN